MAKTILNLPVLEDSLPDRRGATLIFGYPFDIQGVSVPGARYAPSFFREFARDHQWITHNGLFYGAFDAEQGDFLIKTGTRIIDIGDVELSSSDITPRTLQAAVSDFTRTNELEKSKFVAVGGDHSLTYHLMQQLEVNNLIIFDAHLDAAGSMSDTANEVRSNNFINHLKRNTNVERLCVIGPRERFVVDLPASYHAVGFSSEDDVDKISARLEAIFPIDSPVHVSFDLDIINPAELPDVTSPVPAGPPLAATLGCLREVFSKYNVMSCDIVEFLVDRKTNFTSSHIFEEVLTEMLIGMSQK